MAEAYNLIMRNSLSSLSRYFVFLIFFSNALHPCIVKGQTSSETVKSLSIPAYRTDGPGDIGEIASAINNSSFSSAARIREIYSWVAQNIAYDPGQISNPDPYTSKEDLINQVLQKRKAICQGYAALFDSLCELCNIQSFVIHGYIKHNDIIDDIPHAWVAANLDGSWFLFDPTWGAGYMQNNEFVPRFSYDFYKISPAESLKSRMPFDPVWQLMKQPVSHKEFITGKPSGISTAEYNFNDSISVFLTAGKEDRIAIESRRVLEWGLLNKQITDYSNYLLNALDVIKKNKQVERNNEVVNWSNEAILNFNKAITAYNLYINAKNKQFMKPAYTDEQVKNLIQDPHALLYNSELILNNLEVYDPVMKKNLGELSRNIAELRKTIDQERAFVDNYCQTPAARRIMLFRSPARQGKSHK